MSQRAWYRIVNAADAQSADLYVYDMIGKSWWDDSTVTAKQFIADLAALPETVAKIRVHVNSPGGDVFDAIAIANALKAHAAEIEMSIEGLAASAATIITSAGNTIRMARNSLVMVHNPQGFVMGGAEDMRKIAGLLDKVRDSIVATYQWHSTLDAAALIALMDATTWMDADEALAKGFATEIVDDVAVEARFRPAAVSSLGAVPEKYRPRVEALTERPAAPPARPQAADPKAVIKACREAGFPELAEDLLGQPMDAITARLTEEGAARAARDARAEEIRGLCATAKLPELADGYIAGVLPVADVRTHLTTITAKLDKVEIDAHLPTERGGQPGGPLNVTEFWSEHRKQLAAAKGA